MATLLVVDDSAFARRVHRAMLEQAGHQARVIGCSATVQHSTTQEPLAAGAGRFLPRLAQREDLLAAVRDMVREMTS